MFAIFEKAINTPITVEENISRGEMAMQHVILSHAFEPNAMFRQDTGWIGFEWGVEGKEPPTFANKEDLQAWLDAGNKPYKGGHGVAHIIAKRDWEGRFIRPLKGQIGQVFATKIPEIIAKGRIARGNRYAKRLTIDYKGNKIVLTLVHTQNKERIYLLTGYVIVDPKDYIVEFADGVGVLAFPSTHADSFLARFCMGAANSTESMITDNRNEVKDYFNFF